MKSLLRRKARRPAPAVPPARPVLIGTQDYWHDDPPAAAIAKTEVPEELPVALRHCVTCDVKWEGGPACWCCGRRVTG